MRTLAANSILLSIATLGAQALSAAVFWLVARQLPPSEFGPIMAAVGIATLLMTALDFGVNALTIRELAKAPEDIQCYRRSLTSKLVVSFGLGAAWSVTAAALGTHSVGFYSVIPLGMYITFADATGSLLVPFRSAERMSVVAAATLIQNAATLLAVALLLFVLDVRQPALPLAMAAGCFASAVFASCALDGRLRSLRRPSLADIRRLWTSSLGFGFASLAAQVQRGDVALVGAIAGASASGLYAAPARLTNLLGALPTALSAALYPRVARQADSSRARREALTAIGAMVAMVSAGFGVIFFLARLIVHLALGPEYLGSVPILRVYLVGMIFASANGPLSALIQAEGDERYVARAVGAASIAGLIGVAVGAALYGAVGAAFGFLALQLIIFLAFVAHLRADAAPASRCEQAIQGARHAHP